MPFRLTSGRGVQGNAYLQAGHWELGVTYRWLRAHGDDFFVGTERNPPLPATQPPGDEPIEIDVHTVTLGLTYAATERIRIGIAAPLQTGTASFFQEDHARHTEKTTGFGDVTITGGAWLLSPRAQPTGNVMLGLGLKIPTGSYSDSVAFFTPTGAVPRPADPSIQPGDGGWGIIMELQAFQQLLPGTVAYLSGSYLLNPKVQTDVTIGRRIGLPGNSASGTEPYYMSVPDAYTVRGGVSYAVLPGQGLSASIGGRIDAVPVEDLVNGGDNHFRRPGYGAYVDLGLDLNRGSSAFSLNIPVRAHADRRANLFDREVNVGGGGNLAKFQVLASYTYRF